MLSGIITKYMNKHMKIFLSTVLFNLMLHRKQSESSHYSSIMLTSDELIVFESIQYWPVNDLRTLV